MTTIAIAGDNFLIDGVPTYAGRHYQGAAIEGLLFNTRMVQAIFDDESQESRNNWAYPDTGKWDPERNLREFIAALPSYRAHGVLAVTLNLQGGMPIVGTERKQPWLNTAFTPEGELKPAYLDRAERAIRACDAAGIVVILGYFYFGQDQKMASADAIRRGTASATRWLLEKGFTNVLVEVDNECNVPEYTQDILKLAQVHELIEIAKSTSLDGRRMLVSASITSTAYLHLPPEATARVLATSDFALLHTNGCNPESARRTVEVLQANPAFASRPQPLVINEDSANVANMRAVFPLRAPWGYYDQGRNNYVDGFQSVPVNWSINTDAKRAFFDGVATITGAKG